MRDAMHQRPRLPKQGRGDVRDTHPHVRSRGEVGLRGIQSVCMQQLPPTFISLCNQPQTADALILRRRDSTSRIALSLFITPFNYIVITAEQSITCEYGTDWCTYSLLPITQQQGRYATRQIPYCTY